MNEALLRPLCDKSLVRSVEFHEELDSTNSRAVQLAADPPGELPMLIVANRQTAGRGRGCNRWWAGEGALTFSLLLKLSAAESAATRLSLVAGLAVCDTLLELAPGLNVGLKWPNDVLVDQRKLAGVLVEVPQGTRTVVGIGMNVNNGSADAPLEIRRQAVALIDLLQYPLDRILVLTRLLNHFERTQQLAQIDPAAVHQRFAELCVLTGHTLQIQTPAGLFTGVCTGIDITGALLLQHESGQQRILSGTVKNMRIGS